MMEELLWLADGGDCDLVEEQWLMMEEFAYHAVVRQFCAHGYGEWVGLVKLPGKGKGKGAKCQIGSLDHGISPC